MSAPTLAPVPALEALNEVLASRTFAGTRRLRELLQFLVDKTVRGEADEIKEFLIATEVYGRSVQYDPQVDSTVRVEVGRLRKKLADYYAGEGHDARLRFEIPRGSYVPLFVECAPTPGPYIEPEPVPIRRSWAPWLLGAMIMTALLGTLLSKQWSTPQGAANAVAVLPFVALSDGGGSDQFAASLTADVTAAAAQTGSVRVAAQSTMQAFRNRAVPPGEVAKRTGAGAVLEGSVRRDADRALVTVQLVSATSGYTIWARTWEERGTDANTLSRKLGGEVGRALAEFLKSGAQSAAAVSVRPELMASYLDADRLLRQRVLQNGWPGKLPENVSRAIRMFEDVTKQAPDFARGWVALGEAKEWAYELDPAHPRALLDAARAAVERAIHIDSNQADAHARLASIYFYGYRDLTAAEKSVRRAIELNPRDVRSTAKYADLLRIQGRVSEALTEISRALVFDPAATRLWAKQALLYYDLDRFEDAIRAADHSLQLNDGQEMNQYSMALWVRGLSLERLGRRAEAEQAFRTALARTPQDDWNQPSLGWLLARSGRTSEARAFLHHLEQQGKKGRGVSYAMALIHVGLGDNESALKALEHGVATGDTSMPFLKLEKRFVDLAGTARFRAVAERAARTAG